jgi:hypothetical protein
MKRKIILSIALMMFISYSGFSLSHKKAPSKAVEYIQRNYVHAGKVHWGKSHDLISAYFEEDNRDIILLFSKDGILKQSEEDVNPDQLPQNIKNKIETEGSKIQYESISKVQSTEDDIYYLITTRDKNEKKYLTETYASEDGTKFEAYKYKDKKNRAVLVGILALFPLLFL